MPSPDRFGNDHLRHVTMDAVCEWVGRLPMACRIDHASTIGGNRVLALLRATVGRPGTARDRQSPPMGSALARHKRSARCLIALLTGSRRTPARTSPRARSRARRAVGWHRPERMCRRSRCSLDGSAETTAHRATPTRRLPLSGLTRIARAQLILCQSIEPPCNAITRNRIL